MTLDEALASIWPKTGKSVEESIREGLLTYQDLRVAANRSPSEQVKAIAGTILPKYEDVYARTHAPKVNQTFLVNLPSVSLTLEEARATPWIAGQHKGEPMGFLVDKGSLALKDLVWAVESSFTTKAREAARVLLFVQLQTKVVTPERDGGAKVVQAGVSYSREKVDDIFTFSALVSGFGGGGLYVLSMLNWSKGSAALMWWITGVLLVAGVGYLFLRMKTVHSHNQGADEEDRVAARLATVLDPSWTILRNVRKKGIPGDLDIVLVGPGGVFALEVKKWKAELRIEGEKTFFACDGKRRGGYGNPVDQVRRGAKALYQYLASKGVKVPVEPILAVSVASLTLENPAVTVWRAEDAGQEAAWLPSSTRSEFDAAKVVALLDESGGK